MAMNVAVNVEWYSADRLHEQFADKSNSVLARSEESGNAHSRMRTSQLTPSSRQA